MSLTSMAGAVNGLAELSKAHMGLDWNLEPFSDLFNMPQL